MARGESSEFLESLNIIRITNIFSLLMLSIYTKILANLKKSQNHIFVSQEPSVALGPLELLLWKGQVDPELAKRQLWASNF